MDKNAIKKYAIWARRELIERVSQRAMIYGISAEEAGDPNADNINGHLLSPVEKRQRQALIRNISEKGYEQVMEEVAYTWFNRFAALRFMEVNGYLPSHIRVFTNDAGEFKPQILTEAIHLELDGLDMSMVYELESANKSEELFKYLLIVQCNALNSILPGMFQRIEDYTELLLPDYLLREGSVIEQMVTTIPEEDWTDQVQIIGWLYQYYNTEPKDKVFADLKKNIKITKESVPAATQLFTPDWIVHYMVENSLGRIFIDKRKAQGIYADGRGDEELSWKDKEKERINVEEELANEMGWKYYLAEAEQEPEVRKQLEQINSRQFSNPLELKVIDPCCGSGHILCVFFDVLVQIYEEYGYTAREAAIKIVENNLWGLDIDERAAQLSYFTVMMKSRQYDRRFFTRKVQPHVYAIEESNGITTALIHDMGLHLAKKEYSEAVKQAMRLVEEMHDAKEYGSIIHVTPCDWDLLRRFAVPREDEGQLYLDVHGEIEASIRLQKLINIGESLAQKYDVVVTNPPYMGSSGMGAKLSKFVKDNYTNSKSDLFAVFIERCKEMTTLGGYQAMITQHAWMFLSSFEKLRTKLMDVDTINMAHLGAHAFDEIGGEVVQTTSFVMHNRHIPGYKGTYCRLINPTTQQGKEDMFLHGENRFSTQQDNFALIPGIPVSYWISEALYRTFNNAKVLGDLYDARSGLQTNDNNRFLRFWYEVRISNASLFGYDNTKKWFPHLKGGPFRRWYGNNEYVVNWENNGEEILSLASQLYGSPTRTAKSIDKYFIGGITWSDVTSGLFSVRRTDRGFIFDTTAPTISTKDGSTVPLSLLALLNTKVAQNIMQLLAPTIHYNCGAVSLFPLIEISFEQEEYITKICEDCISLSRMDWDSFETSWDFKEHPLVAYRSSDAIRVTVQGEEACTPCTLSSAYSNWARICRDRFLSLKHKEEELNRLFIEIYGLQEELTPIIEDKDVTVRRADLQREVRSFISYAVGCMFGRYSLGKPGLIYAGGEWDASEYTLFQPDKDAIIPICDDEYFEDDIVDRFVKFVEVVYGKETLEDNLRFLADAIGGKGSSREAIRNYFINDFYANHLKVYQKRPIYWLFDSGKKNGFKCLIYMHRYQPDTIARIRTDYVHEQQSRYRTAIADLEQRVDNASGSERVKLSKQLAKLQAQEEEVRVYEEKIHHLADQMIEIDLDDGVKHNYALFKDVLAKIK